MNMLQTIVPKSDQLNADDLIGQTMTIKVSDVRFKAGDDQPVSIHFLGDDGKPYKPCKSMRRVLVQAWGADANKYLGRSMSLYRDPKVLWGGQAVGGIRITHLSHIDSPLTMALTATRGSRKAYTVNVLTVSTQADAASLPASVASKAPPSPTIAEYETCASLAGLKELETRRRAAWSGVHEAARAPLEAAKDAAKARLLKAAEQPATTAERRQFQQPAALLSLQEAGKSKDAAGLEAAWSAIASHFDSINAEIPMDLQAAYHFAKELIAQ